MALECIKGNKNKEVALRLGISAETVNKTLDNIYRATGVNSRDQLVAKLLIADIENTPLHQAITLAGEGSALVGAGFLATLYESRSERKRPRSLRSVVSASRAEETSKKRSKESSTSVGSGSVAREGSRERGAAATAFASVTSESINAPERIPASIPESLPWMSSPDLNVETPIEN